MLNNTKREFKIEMKYALRPVQKNYKKKNKKSDKSLAEGR